MSEELDRRVAAEVMGEQEPKVGHFVTQNWRYIEVSSTKENKVWYEFKPAPFSTSLEEALRAVDKYFAETQPQDSHHEPEMYMEYRPYANTVFCVSLDGEFGLAQTLPEAICNLLLALKEESK